MRMTCIICEGEIYRSRTHGCKRTRRKPDSITCSKKCSRAYIRVQNHIRSNLERKIKKEMENDKQ